MAEKDEIKVGSVILVHDDTTHYKVTDVLPTGIRVYYIKYRGTPITRSHEYFLDYNHWIVLEGKLITDEIQYKVIYS